MQFPFPFIDVLVLPTDAGPGDPRIEIDGINGSITVYDADGDVRFRVGLPAGTLELGTGDVDELFLGSIQATISGAGGTRRLALVTETPQFTGQSRGTIGLYSESLDGTVETLLDVIANVLALTTTDVSQPAAIKVDGKVIGKGVIKQFTSDSSFAAVSVSTTTDMVLNNVPVIGGDLYAVHVHTPWEVLATPGRWLCDFLLNGTVVDRFDDTGNLTADEDRVFDGTVFWTPSATASTDDLAVRLTEVSGASNISLPAAASAARTLTLTHLGQPQ